MNNQDRLRQAKAARRRRRASRKKGQRTVEKVVTTQQCVELIGSRDVAGLRFANGQTTIRVAQIVHAARPVADGYEAARRSMLEDYGSIDPETSQLASNPDGTLKFKHPTGKREFETRHRELLEATTTVVVPAVTDADLQAEGAAVGAIIPLLPFVAVTLA
jgi:hypothetical protein